MAFFVQASKDIFSTTDWSQDGNPEGEIDILIGIIAQYNNWEFHF